MKFTVVRNTRQREAILKALRAAGRPLTAQEICDLGQAYAPRLGLRTVYRNLRSLSEQSQVAGVDYPGQPPRYELVQPHGDRVHFICRSCNRLYDLDMAQPIVRATPPEGFKVTGEEVVLYGECPQCHGKG
ncbi:MULTISPECIES: Fur family transcriptional regulator [unclassified Lentimonas]|uniref:Fur family transcriptional regulator n=1 Tax=unclassified Lentimonas TaxID=2630993 RepID=UPI0013280B5D|nr:MULTISPECIES: transcriptional repressor [unclassified Lentimonas]CAA6691568.1 Peroxide stress regulator; Ferric uptake regulation protein; Fe2+/Zn2+ uptake regulation proteins [Lentimonas sp. CC10]CAA6696233.1 Peroxide stress regulator; Ferric uptake regulation protein; Fe2+/Zn2+ uptake regulation proteins [Lentimonas sp. CC19]CAA7070869.1 Peroxide stress regulator; Ferric uptake regulation protein; Fe2+/Zn2+ uptake regulation proteins [Lentimonas sp. CC11]